MNEVEKKKLTALLLKYQLVYFTLVLCLSLFVIFGYYKIQNLIAESLYKTNVNELLVQDFRAVILNMDQFVPSQFVAIKLLKENQEIFNIGELQSHFLIYKSKHLTKDQMTLVFYSSYRLVLFLVGTFLLLSLFISRLLNRYLSRMFSKQLEDQVKLKQSELLNEISKKVAHDIRSPLSTLNMLAAAIENSEIREMQEAVTKQIDKIANDLLNFSKNQQLEEAHSLQSIKQLFYQMKKEYELKSSKRICQIIFDDQLSFDVNLPSLTVLYQNINNFINNSIEANAKNITVVLKKEEDIQISVTDDGHGMDEHTLNKVGKVEHTTKRSDFVSGNGIALLNAQKSTSSLGWQMQLQSTLGTGTTITIIIPLNNTRKI